MNQEKLASDGYLNMELLRFTTAGSVDDGKSTLIGRLLYDSKSIFQDQIDAIEKASKNKGKEVADLALLTDGLKAEREQGITIDVAYRYFATPKRKFIIADTPGHIQYTRNMVTGASTANVALILIDARNGVIEQTLRHSYIASLLQIPHLVVCVNKMDLVEFSEERFEQVKKHYLQFAPKFNVKDIHFIPISALNGDNVVDRSVKMDWYKGTTLLDLLENIYISGDVNHEDPRFPIQYVIRPQTDEFHDYRGYAGRIDGGIFNVGDKVTVLPSGYETEIESIDTLGESLQTAFAPQSVSITLKDDIDISRGNMLVKSDNVPLQSQDITAMMCWFNPRALIHGGKYLLKHNTNEVKCVVKDVPYKMDINSLEENREDTQVKMNDIAKIVVRTAQPLFFDSYERNRRTGSFILVDEVTNETMGAGMIV